MFAAIIQFWNVRASEIYWSLWIALGFLVPEVLAGLHLIPMMTLSRTSWFEESRWEVMRTILFGFLIGLCIHIVFRTGLWKTEAASLAFAFLAHAAWAKIP